MTNLRNTKRALLSSVVALLICFSMLLGTTFAWFTDSVTSSGNIIQSGNLNAEMYWALATQDFASATWNDVEDEQTEKIFTHTNWEPGYVDAKHIKIVNNGSLAFNYKVRITASDVVSALAGVIDVYVVNHNVTENKPAEVLTREALVDGIKIGTLMDVLGTNMNLAKTINGSIVANGDPQYWTIALKMQETANDDYQGMNLGSEFDIQLIATQMSNEADSFGPDYDLNDDENTLVPNPELPAAKVTSISPNQVITVKDEQGNDVVVVDEGIKIKATVGIGGAATEANLNAGFKFEPTMTLEQAEASQYRYWHADFVVKADKDIPSESLALAGYYTAWCSLNDYNWVALPAVDIDDTDNYDGVKANTEIRLVGTMAGGFYVNWEALCEYGNDGLGFACGLVDLTGENAGTTVTVELRLYETTGDWSTETGPKNEETGVYKTVGTFTYTFPAVEVADQTELDAAIANGVTDISLPSGEYTIPDSAQGKTLTISGNGETVVSVVDDGASEGDIDYSFDGSTVTFNNLTLNIKGSDHPGYARMSATYNNCTIVGSNYTLYGDSVFNNCTFNLNNGYVWTWGASKVEFNNCTFEDTVGGAAKAILVHNTTETVVTVKDCTFIATTPAYTWDSIPVAAVSIDPENGSPDATVKFVGNNTFSSAFYALYQVKYSDEVDDVTVYVNDVEVENITAMK